MNRRTFLKALAIAGVSPSLLPFGAEGSETRKETPKGAMLIVSKLKPLTNVGVGDDDCYEEELKFEYNIYSVDANGNNTFVKTLNNAEYCRLTKMLLE